MKTDGQTLLIINNNNDSLVEVYKNKYKSCTIIKQSELEQVDEKIFTKLLIVGKFEPIFINIKIRISWLITDFEDDFDHSLLNKGYYDQIDNFFMPKPFEDISSRYGDSFVHQGDKIFFNTRTSAPIYLDQNTKDRLINTLLQKILLACNSRNIDTDLKKIRAGLPLNGIVNNTSKVTIDNVKKEIMFSISNDPKEPYNSNLFDNMYNTPNFLEFLKNLIDVFYRDYGLKTASKNITLFNTNFHNVHRSGWQYIVNGLAALESSNKIIIDTYVDKTFGWSSSFNEWNNVVPYMSTWFGFLHHTDSSKINFNLQKTIDSLAFKQSLPFCRGLIVFTSDLRNRLISLLQRNGLQSPIIYVMNYPTETNVPKFNLKEFSESRYKKIIQIGAFLRNLFGIYRLELDPNNSIQKCILAPVENVVVSSKSILNDFDPRKICDVDIDSSLIGGIKDYIFEKSLEVAKITRVDNEQYDELLSKNIVFLNLYDAAAVNTLVECIARGTPVLINRIPAVVEFLGSDYPFYYSSFYEASKKATDIDLIRKTFMYLKNLNLERYFLSVFLKNMQTILKV